MFLTIQSAKSQFPTFRKFQEHCRSTYGFSARSWSLLVDKINACQPVEEPGPDPVDGVPYHEVEQKLADAKVRLEALDSRVEGTLKRAADLLAGSERRAIEREGLLQGLEFCLLAEMSEDPDDSEVELPPNWDGRFCPDLDEGFVPPCELVDDEPEADYELTEFVNDEVDYQRVARSLTARSDRFDSRPISRVSQFLANGMVRHREATARLTCRFLAWRVRTV